MSSSSEAAGPQQEHRPTIAPETEMTLRKLVLVLCRMDYFMATGHRAIWVGAYFCGGLLVWHRTLAFRGTKFVSVSHSLPGELSCNSLRIEPPWACGYPIVDQLAKPCMQYAGKVPFAKYSLYHYRRKQDVGTVCGHIWFPFAMVLTTSR